MRCGLGVSLVFAALVAVVPLAAARAEPPPEADFAALSLEELMDVDVVEVTSLTLRSQTLAETAAAAFVISESDIRRSGATSIPELLRMVPGVEVAQIDANKWAVSMRGFNGRFGNKLLVMIDGMTVYTPYFSNVFWDVEDVPLAMIERIEVIRGPGGSIWGANAVNGVVNIITKRAEDTQGVLLSGGGGTELRAFSTARYGGRIGERSFYRDYAKVSAYDDAGRTEDGQAAADGWNQKQAGFRFDTETSTGDPISLSGRLYEGDNGTTGITVPVLTPPYALRFDDTGQVSGASLQGSGRHTLSATSAVDALGYYQRTNRKEQGLIFNLDTIDLDVHQHYDGLSGHALTGGIGYRFIRNRLDGTFALSFSPKERVNHLFSAFLQDEMSLIPDRLRLTVGAKVENNDSTGFEIQPSARIIWTPNRRHSLWAAASRAVRTPTIAEEDVRLNVATLPPGAPGNPGPAPVLISLFGDRDLGAEELYALEAGYRVSPNNTLALDIAAFVNIYDNLRTFTAATPRFETDPPPAHGLAPFFASNDAKGTAHGFEAAARWDAAPWLRLNLAYTYLDLDLQDRGDLGILDQAQGSSPQHQVSLRAMADLGGGWQLDLWPRYVDNLSSLGVESYFDLDARIAWRPNDRVEFAIVGQNLLDSRRKEFVPEFLSLTPTQVERGVYAKLTLTF